MTPSNFVGDLTNFDSTNFHFAHGTIPKTVQMQPAKPTAQRAEETKPTTSIIDCPLRSLTNRPVVSMRVRDTANSALI